MTEPTNALKDMLDRAYRDGKIDAQLADFEKRFLRINGSIDRTGNELQKLSKVVSLMSDQLHGILVVMPSIQNVAKDADKAKIVAATLADKTEADRSTWDRHRMKVAWVAGLFVGFAAVANSWVNLFH